MPFSNLFNVRENVGHRSLTLESYLISTWYTRKEQQLRFAFLQAGEVTVVGLGGFLNFGLFHLDGKGGLAGWRWMFLVQGMIAVGKETRFGSESQSYVLI